MMKTALIALFLFLAQAASAQNYRLEFGYPNEGNTGLDWQTTIKTTEPAVNIRVAALGSATLEGAWVTIVTRVRSIASPATNATLPAWIKPADQAVTADTLITNSSVWAALSSASQTALAATDVETDGDTTTAFIHNAFGSGSPIASFWQAGKVGDESHIYWKALPSYWGTGFGAQRWGNTYQETVHGSDQLNLLRVAEMGMVLQAQTVAGGQTFLRSSQYADMLSTGGCELVMQAVILQADSPSFSLSIGDDTGLPVGPTTSDCDILADFTEPIVVNLPISKPDDPTTGNQLASAPGAFVNGVTTGSDVYFFVGLAMEVDTAVFPVIGGTTATATLSPANASFPDSGVYICQLPVPVSSIDASKTVELKKSGVSLPADVVKLREVEAEKIDI